MKYHHDHEIIFRAAYQWSGMVQSKFTKELSFPDISKSHTSPLTFHYVFQKSTKVCGYI